MVYLKRINGVIKKYKTKPEYAYLPVFQKVVQNVAKSNAEF